MCRRRSISSWTGAHISSFFSRRSISMQQVVVPGADLLHRAIEGDVQHLLPGQQRVDADADQERGLADAGAGHHQRQPARAGAGVAVALEQGPRRAAQRRSSARS